MSDSNKHGGRRRGAGRKPRTSEPVRAVTVSLTEHEIDKAKEIGTGQISKGIGIAIETFEKLEKELMK